MLPANPKESKMHTEVLWQRSDPGRENEHRERVFDALTGINRQRLRIYRTFAPYSRHYTDEMLPVTFVTTSKDVHLALGQFDKDSLFHLGRLIESMFKDYEGPPGDLLLYKDRDQEAGWHVVRTETADGITFNMSPAHPAHKAD